MPDLNAPPAAVPDLNGPTAAVPDLNGPTAAPTPCPTQRQATTVATEPGLIAHALREGWRANRWHDFVKGDARRARDLRGKPYDEKKRKLAEAAMNKVPRHLWSHARA
eukprot:16197821-Heterocapsa_arctica.AAC.1